MKAKLKCFTFFVLILSHGLFAQGSDAEAYGKNKLVIAPLVAYGSSSFGEVGLGLGYERFLNPYVALQTAISFGLKHDMAQVMIGPKFYVHQHDKPVCYALAPLFLVSKADVNGKSKYSDQIRPYHAPRIEGTSYQFGFMLVNSLNMTLSERIYFGVEAGVGLNYIDRFESSLSDDMSENKIAGNRMVRISMGYRF